MKKFTTTFRTKLAAFWHKGDAHPRIRWSLVVTAAIFVGANFWAIVGPLFSAPSAYALGSSADLLPTVNDVMAGDLKYDTLKQSFSFQSTTGTLASGDAGSSTTVSASSGVKASDGLTVTDPTNQVNLHMTPLYKLGSGRKDGDRVVYPLASSDGWLVNTYQGTGVKENILLAKSPGKSQTFSYKLDLGDNFEARIENDGGIGVYGNTTFSGNVSTGNDSDALLLQKARQNAKKDTLMFVIPAPTILGKDHKPAPNARGSYKLNGSSLDLTVTGLDAVTYPLAIDPSIYVVTAAQFMAGNNETNINFDVANKLIEKGPTTGARFDTWQSTTSLTAGTWAGGTAAAGGYIYTAGGISFNGQVYNTQGNGTLTVPAGVTSISVKMWGAGGGGGGGGNNYSGGAGGGGGFTQSTITVTPGETLSVYVGGGGQGGAFNNGGNDAGGGGGGGGASSLYRNTTLLGMAAGGGGGGGARTSNTAGSSGTNGGTGGAGGGTTGVTGASLLTNNGRGGTGGTQTAGGTAGTAATGANAGSNGSSLNGGDGGDGRNGAGADGSGATGGASANGNTGGNGGIANVTTTRAGGGGGGAGFFGGAGGGGTSSTTGAAGGGGGGGSSYTTGASTTNTAGNGSAPGNDTDSSRNGAGDGGAGGGSLSAGNPGATGLVVVSYGTGSVASQAVNWAKFNTSTGTIDSTNPGEGTCSGWCTTSAYSLPSARSNFSLVAYNGFLYAIGGIDGAGNRQNTVYIAKLGANGEPQLWHPTDKNQTNWVYWYQDTNLSSVRSDFSAVAYNNRMYLVGGRNSTGPVSTVEIADIKPTGQLGTWASGATLPSATYGENALVYNDRLYVVGGANTVGGAPSTSVLYNKINSDGSLNAWQTSTPLTTGRMSSGGNFAVIWGAYIYVSGGCTSMNASGYCTTVASDSQVASINADGSVDVWNTIGNVSNQVTGFGMIAWRNNIYEVGGCGAQDATTGVCSSITPTILYGTINQDGDASTVDQSVASGTTPCAGTAPYSCNLPTAGTGAGQVGQLLTSTAVMNGYLYVIGGCSTNACTTTSGNTAYAAIASNGSLTKPASCVGTYYGSWCVDSTHTVAGGIGAAASVVFGGRIYLVGGLTGSANKNTINYINVNADGSLSTDGWTAETFATSGVTASGYAVSYEYAYGRANPSQASTNPGNLYIFGGCSTSSAAGCTAYSAAVYKCNIALDGSINGCTTSGQLQIGTIPGDTAAGLGIMAGTVYANYIYLIGGVSPNQVDLKTTRYAKFDNNNNIVAVSGSSWVESSSQTEVGRRRGAAFGYNGYIYVVGGYDASTGVLADIEFAKVNVSDGSVGTFSTSSVSINQRWGLSVPVSNSYAYVIGGCDDGNSPTCNAGGLQPVVQTFQIYNNDSGAPAGYTAGANRYTTNPNRVGTSSAILNGRLYVAGGCVSSTDCTNAINTVSSAPLDAYGALGAWTDTATLPADRAWGKMLAAGNSLYYVGGQDDTATNEQATVYYAAPNGATIASWGTATNGLPAARTKFGAASWNGRLYIVGGLDSNATPTNTIYASPQLSSGGNITSAWSTGSTGFNVARSGTSVVAYANNLYLFGGYDGSNYLSDSQYAQINSSNGNVGSWTYTTSLPRAVSQADAFAANGYIYLVGGRSDAVTCDARTLVAPVSANTTVASGNNPTGIGEWFETNQRYTGARYGASATYSDGKAYIVGGACPTTTTPSVTEAITSNAGSGFATDSTVHGVTMPAHTTAGDLLLMFLTLDDTTATVADPDGAGGWTQIATGVTSAGGATGTVWAKVATGADFAAVNFVSSNSQSAAAIVYHIAAGTWSGNIADGISVATGTSTTSTSSDPPSLTPSWGSTQNLWLEYVAGSTHTSFTPSTNYTNGSHIAGGSGTTGASTSSAYRTLSAATEDPGAATMGTSFPNIPFTVAVRPSNSNLGYAGSNEVQQTALLSQPQVAKYSIMIDTDSDVFTNYWLLNGVDNSIGARWQLKYRSMTNTTTSCTSPAMTTWGSETNFGDVTLGTPGSYIPKNASGTSTNCARFFYFNISVDSSQAYGYPDDYTRGPTVTDLTLQFTADPAKRLMHGRTFTGGLQQPDDSPLYTR